MNDVARTETAEMNDRFEHLNEDHLGPGELWACNRCGCIVWIGRLAEHKLLCWAEFSPVLSGETE